MSATVKFVKPQHEAILREYLDSEDNIDYDFGGHPEKVVDVVSSLEHYVFSTLKAK